MLPGKAYKPEDVLKILRKRFWLIVVPWAVIGAGTAGFARQLPDEYRSRVVIQVVPPRVPDAVAKQSSSVSLADRLKATEQVILSRTRLERLVQEFNLYPEERKTKVMDEVVARMRADILVAPQKGEAFLVQYVGRNPATVMKVAERLGSHFMEESQRDSERRAEGTSQYIEAAVEEKKRQLLDIEARVTKFKMQHATELPSQVGSNQNALQSVQNRLSTIAMALAGDANRKTFLERQIETLENQTEPVAVPVTGGDPSVMRGSAAERLAQAKAQLEILKLKGQLPSHFEYQRIEKAIQSLQKEADAEALRAPVSSGAGLSAAERTRQKQLADSKQEVETLGKQAESYRAEEKRLMTKAAEYQGKIDAAPVRDAEMTELMREYNAINSIYQSQLSRREAANASVNVERRQLGEQFTLVDAARLPERPSSPDRMTINLIGLAVGLGVGLALVLLLEYRDNSFKNDAELARVLGLPVLAVVPLMMSDGERRTRFRRRLLLNVGLGGAVAVCGAVLAYSFIFLR